MSSTRATVTTSPKTQYAYPMASCFCSFMFLLAMILIGVSLSILAAAVWRVTYVDDHHTYPAFHIASYASH